MDVETKPEWLSRYKDYVTVWWTEKCCLNSKQGQDVFLISSAFRLAQWLGYLELPREESGWDSLTTHVRLVLSRAIPLQH